MKKIRIIAAIDSKRGLANNGGIPWDIPIDRQYFRDKTDGQKIIMGFNTYQEFNKPWQNRQNYVWCRPGTELREGFHAVHRLKDFLLQPEIIWVIGGAGLFVKALEYTDQLYLTQIDHNFRCTKFFPKYDSLFRRKSQSPDHHQNGLAFRFEVWERLKLNNPRARKV